MRKVKHIEVRSGTARFKVKVTVVRGENKK
jgi:hypothetical protein